MISNDIPIGLTPAIPRQNKLQGMIIRESHTAHKDGTFRGFELLRLLGFPGSYCNRLRAKHGIPPHFRVVFTFLGETSALGSGFVFRCSPAQGGVFCGARFVILTWGSDDRIPRILADLASGLPLSSFWLVRGGNRVLKH